MPKTGFSYGALVDHVQAHTGNKDNPHGVTAEQANAVSTLAGEDQVMAENLSINKAGVSGLSLETDSSGISIRNLAVPDNKYRSIGINDNGKAQVYSRDLGFKDIYHEGNKPTPAEIGAISTLVEGDGVDIAGSGVSRTISIERASTTNRGGVVLSESTTSSSRETAATSSAVKRVQDSVNKAVNTIKEGEGIDLKRVGNEVTISGEAASTSNAGIVRLNNSITSNSRTMAATPKAILDLKLDTETKLNDSLSLKVDKFIQLNSGDDLDSKSMTGHYAVPIGVLNTPYGSSGSGTLIVTGGVSNTNGVVSQVFVQASRNSSIFVRSTLGSGWADWETIVTQKALRDPHKTLISSKVISSGNFTMDQPWTNFDAILVIGSDDGRRLYVSNIFTYAELKAWKEWGGDFNILRGLYDRYWFGRFGTNNKTFITNRESAAIHGVYGLTYHV